MSFVYEGDSCCAGSRKISNRETVACKKQKKETITLLCVSRGFRANTEKNYCYVFKNTSDDLGTCTRRTMIFHDQVSWIQTQRWYQSASVFLNVPHCTYRRNCNLNSIVIAFLFPVTRVFRYRISFVNVLKEKWNSGLQLQLLNPKRNYNVDRLQNNFYIIYIIYDIVLYHIIYKNYIVRCLKYS